MAKQRQVKMQVRQQGGLAMMGELESRTNEQLLSESRHKVAARALLGMRAAERYEPDQARKYFNEALVGCTPQERPLLRQMMKASLAQAERRPDDLKDALEKLGQAPPSGRQMLMLRFLGLVAPPKTAPLAQRVRGFLLVFLMVVAVLAIGFGLAKLVALPFGGVGSLGAVLLGLLLVVVILGVLALAGRRRQARARDAQRAALPGR